MNAPLLLLILIYLVFLLSEASSPGRSSSGRSSSGRSSSGRSSSGRSSNGRSESPDRSPLRRKNSDLPSSRSHSRSRSASPQRSIDHDTPTAPEPSVDRSKSRKRYHTYTVKEKLEIVDYAKKHKSDNKASKHYDVDRKRIREWKGQEQQLKRLSLEAGGKGRSHLDGAGRPLLDAEKDKELADWAINLRMQKKKVSRRLLRRQAEEIFRTTDLKVLDNHLLSVRFVFRFRTAGWKDFWQDTGSHSGERPPLLRKFPTTSLAPLASSLSM
jgi:hypothetical protein